MAAPRAISHRAVAEAQPRAFDKPALRQDAQPLGTGRDDLADLLAAHRAEGWRHDLFRVEQIQFLSLNALWAIIGFALGLERGPGARRRVAAADQVIDEIDMAGPVDPRFGLAHPALVGCLALVLRPFGGASADDQIGRLQQRLDPEREDLVEIERGGGVVRPDRDPLLQDDRPLIETGGRAEDRQPGLAAAADDRPRYRRR